MRSRTATVLAVAALAAGLAACQDEGTTTVPTSVQPTTVGSADSIPPRTTGLTASSVRVNGTQGTLKYDILVPQVSGGTGSAAAEFNQSMRALLQQRIDRYNSAVSITDTSQLSKVDHIGDHVVSGLLSLSVDGGGAHPWSELITHVTDLDTAAPLEIQDLFTDEQAGLNVLSTQATTLGPQSRAGTYFDAKGVTPTRDHFKTWTATPAGLHLYLQMGQAGPSAMGPIDFTIPWSALASVLKPGLATVLAS